MAQIGGYVDHSGTAVSGMHVILRGQILHTSSGNFKMGFFYSFNVGIQRPQQAVHWNNLLAGMYFTQTCFPPADVAVSSKNLKVRVASIPGRFMLSSQAPVSHSA